MYVRIWKSAYHYSPLFHFNEKFQLARLMNHFYYIQVILASGYFAVFRVKLTAKKLEGIHDGAIQITTDYEVRTSWGFTLMGFLWIIQSFFFWFLEKQRTKFIRTVTVYQFCTLKTELLRMVYRTLVFISS